ncbi:MAG: peptidoglycan-associated lipoprotein Pal [Gammaproteobacteria bacterium]|nr:peptidoglycan-associated lipoprotein Pal [Gammaproteobacteria bacterium]
MGMALVGLATACTTTPKVTKQAAPVEERPAVAGTPAQPAAPAKDSSGVEVLAAPDKGAVAGDPFSDPSSPLSKRVVYFEYDSSEIRDDARPVIEAHAAYLAQRSTASIVLEGHADERGSREYNLALGERRAKAVQQLMLLKGASARQIEVVSFGEERPVSAGHDDMAWSQNRRVELVYSKR